MLRVRNKRPWGTKLQDGVRNNPTAPRAENEEDLTLYNVTSTSQ